MTKKSGKIFLIGYRATGKTSVGRELARMLGRAFVDLDDKIENAAGATIADIVMAKGWDEFRRMEREALADIASNSKKTVVACGGGVVLHEDLMEQIMNSAIVIWLTAPVEIMHKRISSDSKSATRRPALSGQDTEREIIEIYEQRKPLYERFSHFEIDTFEKGPFQLAQEISEAIRYAR